MINICVCLYTYCVADVCTMEGPANSGHSGQTRPNVGEEKEIDHGQAKAESNQKELNEDGAGNCRSYYFSKSRIKLN